MRSFLHWLRRCVAEQRLRQRFPAAVIHAGASADQQTDLARHAVLFRNAALCNSQLGAFSYAVQANTTINNADVGPTVQSPPMSRWVWLHIRTSLVSMRSCFYDNKQPLPKIFVKTPCLLGPCRERSSLPMSGSDKAPWSKQASLLASAPSSAQERSSRRDVAPYAIVAGNPAARSVAVLPRTL